MRHAVEMAVSKRLRAAVHALYPAFVGYGRPATFLACGCCWEGDEVAPSGWRDTSRPIVEVHALGGRRALRDLGLPNIGVIATDVPLTGGTVDVLKHYLPRLCELVVLEAASAQWPDLQVVLSRLADTEEVDGRPWWRWPVSEQAAIGELLAALWVDRRRDTFGAAVDALVAIAGAAQEIGVFLDAWSADVDDQAAANRDAFVARYPNQPPTGWDADDDLGMAKSVELQRWVIAQNR
jgi:hypothetical protein